MRRVVTAIVGGAAAVALVSGIAAPAHAGIPSTTPWNTGNSKAFPHADRYKGVYATGKYVWYKGDLYLQGTLKDTKPKDGHTASLLIMLQIKNKKLNVVKMISVRGSKPKNFSYPTIHNVVHFDVIEEIDNEFKYAPTLNIKRIF